MDPHQVWDGGLVNTLKARDNIHCDPDRLDGCGKRDFVTMKKGYKVLNVGKTSPLQWCRLGSEGQGSSSVGKSWGVAGSKLNVSPWCALAVMKVNTIVDILGLGTGAQPEESDFSFLQRSLDHI